MVKDDYIYLVWQDPKTRQRMVVGELKKQNGYIFSYTHDYKKAQMAEAADCKVRTCYMLSCLAYVTSKAIANANIRAAFGLEEKDKVKASRVLLDTLDAKLIKPVDPDTAPRYMKYVPFWA